MQIPPKAVPCRRWGASACVARVHCHACRTPVSVAWVHGHGCRILIASDRQATLDGSVTHQPCILPFMSQGLIEHLVELIISKDEVFHGLPPGQQAHVPPTYLLSLSHTH